MDEPQNAPGEPVKTQQELLQEKLQAQADRAAMGSRQVGQAALATWQSAKTTSAKLLIVGALLGVISFFLPWFSASMLGITENVSGFGMAKDGQTSLWFFPVMMAAALFLIWLNLHSAPVKHILNARWLILIGAAWSWYWVDAFLTAHSAGGSVFGGALSAGIGFGAYLAAIASFLVLAGSIMQVQEYVRLLPQALADNI